MKLTFATATLAILLMQSHATVAADADIRKETVQFARGASSAVLEGRLKGGEMVDYAVRAGAGQTLTVKLTQTNPQNYFNVLPPGSGGEAMFVGSMGGDYSGVLPTDGDYLIRVYLMRPAARRGESSDYSLSVGVTGKALAPVAASVDALIPGTPFHASAPIKCVPFLETIPRECPAFVMRRGLDGTGTVEIPGAVKRSILFVKGKPVASNAQATTDPMTFERQSDTTVVRLGRDERYEIPDALLTGG
jgi:hypothetical protein